MSVTRGKQFEERFKQDWIRTFPNGECVRLPDQVSGYKYTSILSRGNIKNVIPEA